MTSVTDPVHFGLSPFLQSKQWKTFFSRVQKHTKMVSKKLGMTLLTILTKSYHRLFVEVLKDWIRRDLQHKHDIEIFRAHSEFSFGYKVSLPVPLVPAYNEMQLKILRKYFWRLVRFLVRHQYGLFLVA